MSDQHRAPEWLWVRIRNLTLSRAQDAHETLRDWRRRQANRVFKFAHNDPGELKRAADLRAEAEYHEREARDLLIARTEAMDRPQPTPGEDP